MACIDRNRTQLALHSLSVMALALGFAPGAGAQPPQPIRLAVFAFELEDASAVRTFASEAPDEAAVAGALEDASSEARRELVESGRYALVDVSRVDAAPVKEQSLRKCDGCEAGIAAQLGADQSLLGVVLKASQTDYYVVIQIRDARTGRLVDQQGANFAGTEAGWASGVRMLIKHQVLAGEDAPRSPP